ncbi:hypothetical protein GK047_06490 [Paenibacillus sp. SYP-B3998]|uniref:Uncharacterized protein n=1 Tax=Paenibacillus sp. SYP-B3998 TaxID=2678564 RepID=A0A6G3ZUE9_9BACL|nr:hypothetical protein [Paenibacillus sp. SYP-B3998]NEW05668.1 hypothetical protein [Paenibacillus sp. SYP-B3998]
MKMKAATFVLCFAMLASVPSVVGATQASTTLNQDAVSLSQAANTLYFGTSLGTYIGQGKLVITGGFSGGNAHGDRPEIDLTVWRVTNGVKEKVGGYFEMGWPNQSNSINYSVPNLPFGTYEVTYTGGPSLSVNANIYFN